MNIDPKLGGVQMGSAGRIDEICRQFEAAWQQGSKPNLENYLEGLTGPIRETVFRDLLSLEVSYRRRAGEHPTDSEYQTRFPQYSDTVKGVFSKVGTERPSGHTHVQGVEPPVSSATTSARFTNLQFHAAGGLGEVYRASDESLRREVALKFLQERHGKNDDYVDLFLLEAEITSRLDHPGVVPVYGIGESFDKRPFYAMRFIEGVHFRDAIDQSHKKGLPRRELHRLLNELVAVCNTVAYAHNRGVVHRDIKPDNIMLGKYGETLLVDWGLAITVERDDRAKASGEKTMLLPNSGDSGKSSGGGGGTIGYMSPEQLPGHGGPITPATDIYSLGATLYRVLTNKSPHQGAGETLQMDKIRWGDFPPPSQVYPDVPGALEAICLKAMATNPAQRYASAHELSEDLQAWLSDEAVSVYDEPLSERLVRWGRRNRNWVISGLMAAALVLLVTVVSALDLSKTAARETQARIDAEVAQKETEIARQKAVQAQQTGMRLAARFAAKAVANEIDVRWRILTQESADPQLHPLILEIQDKSLGSPEQLALQKWLETRRASHSIESESWFLTDARGLQMGRDPFKANTIFVDFSDRTYFHGNLNLRDEARKKGARPIDGVTLSTVYLSAGSGSLKVACSVPVWKNNDRQRDGLGVLGMSVELGAFRELQTGLNAGQIAVLVDTRDDQAEGSVRNGLILHHRNLHESHRRRLASGNAALFRVPPELVERLRRLRQLRTREQELAAQESSSNVLPPLDLDGSIDINYYDPLAPEGSPPVTAAFEPVRIETRPLEVRDTGWVVIVQEAPLQVGPPAATPKTPDSGSAKP